MNTYERYYQHRMMCVHALNHYHDRKREQLPQYLEWRQAIEEVYSSLEVYRPQLAEYMRLTYQIDYLPREQWRQLVRPDPAQVAADMHISVSNSYKLREQIIQMVVYGYIIKLPTQATGKVS